MDGTVLLADDDRTIRTVLTQALTRAGCKVHATSSLVTLMRWVEEGKGDLVISDVIMPDGNGLEMLPRIAEARPGLPVIVISAQNTIMTAIQASERAAYDYLPKPFDLPDLLKRVARALAEGHRSRRVPAEGKAEPVSTLPLVGQSAPMQALYRTIARVMNTELPVLITGASGTGKSLVARAIHDLSDRRSLPFVVLRAADILGPDGPQAALARARTGTLVFDELSDFDPEAQAALVRLLDGVPEPSPKIMATAQGDLAAGLESGSVRKDLFYRLSAVTLALPPLRERVEDIPLLAEHFLRSGSGNPARRLGVEALAALRGYSWPGNLRQLENLLHHLSATGAGDEIGRGEVEAVLRQAPTPGPLGPMEGDRLSASVGKHLQRYFDLHGGDLPPSGLYTRILHEIEAPLIEIALEATGGNQAKCAELLGINRNTLRKKLTELDIRVTRRRKLM